MHKVEPKEEPLYRLTKNRHQPAYKLPVLTIICLVAIASGLGFFYFSQTKKAPTTTPEPVATTEGILNYQENPGPQYGLWGKIVSLDLPDRDIKEASQSATTELVVTVSGENKKTYQALIDKTTTIHHYLPATATSPPKLVTKTYPKENLKVGDKIYFSSRVNLKENELINPTDLILIEIYAGAKS